MAIVMLGFMWSMYPSKAANIAIMADLRPFQWRGALAFGRGTARPRKRYGIGSWRDP